jgi:hypothetical protein
LGINIYKCYRKLLSDLVTTQNLHQKIRHPKI